MSNKKYNKSGRHEGCARNCVIGQNKVGANEKKYMDNHVETRPNIDFFVAHEFW